MIINQALQDTKVLVSVLKARVMFILLFRYIHTYIYIKITSVITLKPCIVYRDTNLFKACYTFQIKGKDVQIISNLYIDIQRNIFNTVYDTISTNRPFKNTESKVNQNILESFIWWVYFRGNSISIIMSAKYATRLVPEP